MNLLVTGACGFVGRHFVTRFLDDGHEVTGVDDMSAGVRQKNWMFQPKRRKHELKLYEEDFRKFVQRTTPRPSHFDLVIHCAAVVGGRLKIDGDPLAVATDLAIDAALFQWVAKEKGRKPKLVYFSSSAVYPIELQTRSTNVLLTESMMNLDTQRWGVPDQTYGFAKLAGEFLARAAVRQYGMDVVIYRPFSGYGEDQALDYPFPSIIQRVVKREDPIVVWGSGLQTRDFIHIDDVVEAVVQTKDVLPNGAALNLGRGEAISFLQLARLAADVSGRNCKLHNDPDKPEGVFARVADTYELGKYYIPRIDLKEGIRRALYQHDPSLRQKLRLRPPHKRWIDKVAPTA